MKNKKIIYLYLVVSILFLLPLSMSAQYLGGIGGSTSGESGVDIPLPVVLTYFTANIGDQTVVLNWKTATELNNYGFEVERKTSESDWQILGFIEGYGNSNSPKEYEFTDLNPLMEDLEYRLKQIDTDGNFEYFNRIAKISGQEITDVNVEAIPTEFSLSQNYPNPFNPSTVIEFALPQSANVSLRVFNSIGEEVAELVNRELIAGYHSYNFDASSLTSGIYFYRIVAGNFFQTNKMLLIK